MMKKSWFKSYKDFPILTGSSFSLIPPKQSILKRCNLLHNVQSLYLSRCFDFFAVSLAQFRIDFCLCTGASRCNLNQQTRNLITSICSQLTVCGEIGWRTAPHEIPFIIFPLILIAAERDFNTIYHMTIIQATRGWRAFHRCNNEEHVSRDKRVHDSKHLKCKRACDK